jgi:hypothetical protein
MTKIAETAHSSIASINKAEIAARSKARAPSTMAPYCTRMVLVDLMLRLFRMNLIHESLIILLVHDVFVPRFGGKSSEDIALVILNYD